MKKNKLTRYLVIGVMSLSLLAISSYFYVSAKTKVPDKLLEVVDKGPSGYENIQEVTRDGKVFTVINKPVTDHPVMNSILDDNIEDTLARSEVSASLVIDWNAKPIYDRYLNFSYLVTSDGDVTVHKNYIIDLETKEPFDLKSIFNTKAIKTYNIKNQGELIFKENEFIIADKTISKDDIPDYIDHDYGPHKPKPIIIPKPPVEKPQPPITPPEKPTPPKPPTAVLPDGRKLVAFTFDDGPSSSVTPKVLDIADQYKAKVTFFALGMQIEKFPAIAKDVVNRGHQIASHTFTHPDLVTLNKDQQLDQINRTETIIRDVTGYSKEIMVRPPYGSNNAALLSNVPKMYVNWSVDTLDWKSRNAQSVCTAIMKDTTPGAIVLLHDIYDSTADGFKCAIEQLSAQGYEFVTVEELFTAYKIPFTKGQLYKKGA